MNKNDKRKHGSVSNTIAKYIPLYDADFPNEVGETFWGGKAFADETLDDFFQMIPEWFDEGEQWADYGCCVTDNEGCTYCNYELPIDVINKALKECNIMPITDQDIEKALQDMGNEMIRK